MKIKKISAREILDSRGIPTIECCLELSDKKQIKSSVPSGSSVGKSEAVELRDKDDSRYMGKGVLKAIDNIESIIAPAIIDKTPNIKEIDQIIIDLDSTKNKSKLGANAILAVSISVIRAQAYLEDKPLYKLISELSENSIKLPRPMFNIINGGAHADSGIAFQEFMIMPIGDKFSDNLESAVIIYKKLKKLLHKTGFSTGLGDEGGFAPKFGICKETGIKKALDFISKSIQITGLVPGQDVVYCLDVAASQFFNEETQFYSLGNQKFRSEDLIKFYANLISDYPIVSIEDGLYEQDWDGWKFMTEVLGSKIQLVGDDIFVTNPQLIKKGIEEKVANSVLIKPNQIGTITETLHAISLAKKNNYKYVISHRSGETNDSFISDLAVGTGAEHIKAGAPARGERVAKYNRLLEIEKFL